VVNNDVRDYLNAHVRPPIDDKSMRLYPRRNQAEAYNLERLSQVSGQEFTVATTYTGAKHFIETLKRTAPIAEEISFKIGAVVMLRQNDPLMRWVNGSIGTIQDFESDKLTIELKSGSVVQVEAADFSMVDADGDIVAVATNFPINLAYAATIHKAQGATLDTMVVDLKSLWEPGHTYVALSRVRRGDDLFISRWDEQSIRVDSEVSAFYQ
jgi:ATP-dependent exoDNAse (exonuclease V) alpha subunit